MKTRVDLARRTMTLQANRTRILAMLSAVLLVGGVSVGSTAARTTNASQRHVDCSSNALCTEVQDPEEVFGENNYVGHDEPSTLFYSNRAGSGNQMTWQLTLPSDPSPT